jgi:hypothetical protein
MADGWLGWREGGRRPMHSDFSVICLTFEQFIWPSESAHSMQFLSSTQIAGTVLIRLGRSQGQGVMNI